MGLGSAFIEVKSEGQSFTGSIFIGEFIHNSGNLKRRKRGKKGSRPKNGQLSKSTKISKTKEPGCV